MIAVARAVALIAAGLVLVVAGLTQPRPAAPTADVYPIRPATTAERAEWAAQRTAWQRQQLTDALTEARQQ